MEKLEGKIRNVWIVKLSLLGLILGLVISGLLYGFSNILWLSVLPLAFPALGLYYAVLRYRNWGFETREDHLYLEHGVLRKVYSMIPHVRIQHIDTNRSPVERVLGLSTVRVYTAGSRGADVRIPGLDMERAEKIQEELRKVAIESEKGFDGV